MTKEELNDKYKDIQPLINFYWNSIRYRLINMINPIITIPSHIIYLFLFQNYQEMVL
jgi:hypothetical protein